MASVAILETGVKLNQGLLEILSADEVGNANFSDLEPTPFWNSGKSLELKRHRIHAYPAKFPAFIATKALEFADQEQLSVTRIADIFCGCGTVAYEARRSNIDFWGCDINPVATMIARVKSGTFNVKKLDRYLKLIEKEYPNSSEVTRLHAEAIIRIDYWFSEVNKKKLARILNAINSTIPPTSKYRLFFHCAFSNILKASSRWLTKSIKPQVDPHKSPCDPWLAFLAQYEMMKRAFEGGIVGSSPVQITTANFLKKRDLPANIDLLVTSPPYVTSYEYADLHQLSSLWLEYATDYRHLRKGSIGSTQHELNFETERSKLNSVGSKVITKLLPRDRSIAKAAANYYLDMQEVAQKCHGMLNSNGVAVFVIGNTEYKGVRLENAEHLAQSLLNGGFTKVRVAKRKLSGKILTPYRDEKGRFSQCGEGRHVYGEEFVLIASRTWNL